MSGADAAAAAGKAWRLAGGPSAFAALEILVRDGDRITATVAEPAGVLDWAADLSEAVSRHVSGLIEKLTAPRPPFAGLPLDHPLIMGVVNVTPDSFSDSGDHVDPTAAIAHGKALSAAGAHILDIGGESTRPGAEPVGQELELARVVPVLRGLRGSNAVLSIDTRHARVMPEALKAGAAIINDITALSGDAESLKTVAKSGAPVVLMHMRGEPRTMQDTPTYLHAPLDIYDFLSQRVEACVAAGIERSRIAVDPGIGFGKTAAHNAEVLSQLALFHGLGCAVLLGPSRKSFIAHFSKGEAPKARLAGSLAAALAGVGQGVQILRVHDVAETAQALAVWRALAEAA